MEKRKFERFELEASTRVEYTTPIGVQEIVYVKSREISAGGAYFKSGKPIPSGMPLHIELILTVPQSLGLSERHKDVIVRLNGHVVRNEPEGVAVSFDHAYTLKAFDSD